MDIYDTPFLVYHLTASGEKATKTAEKAKNGCFFGGGSQGIEPALGRKATKKQEKGKTSCFFGEGSQGIVLASA